MEHGDAMKRFPIPAWPHSRAYTIATIEKEIVRAREKYPEAGDHIKLLESYTAELKTALYQRNLGKISVSHCFALACTCAALAIRIAEEGSEPFSTWSPRDTSQVE